MLFKALVAAAWTFSTVPKWCPLRWVLNFGNKKKSHAAKSGLYGGWGSVVVLFWAKNSHTSDKFFGTSFAQIFLMRRSSAMIRWTSVFGSPTSFAINRTFKRQSLSRTAFTRATLFSVLEVEGRPARCSSSTLSLPSLNALCHLKTWDEDKTASPLLYSCFLYNPAHRLVTVDLWYWANQEIWIDRTKLFWDRKYNSDRECINIASCLSNLKEELFCIQCTKMLQFTSVPNFTCAIQPFIITWSRNLKQTVVLPPSCCISFCKYGSFRTVSHFPTICYHTEFHGQTNNGTRTPQWH